MRGLIIGIPLSLALWGFLYLLFLEFGWDAMAFLMIVGALAYIAGTIRKDWTPTKQGEWEDGEPVNYSDAPR